MKKKLLIKLSKDTIFYGLGQGISRFVSLLLAPILTKIFLPYEYGIIDLILTTVGFLILLLSMNFNAGIFREYFSLDEKEKRRLLFSGITSILFLSLFFSFIAFLFANEFSELIFSTNKYSLLFKIAIWQVPLTIVFEHFQTVLRYNNKAKEFLFFTILHVSLTFAFVLYFIIYLGMGIEGRFWANIGAYSVVVLFMSYKLIKFYYFSYDYGYLKKILLFSIPLLPWSFINLFMMRANRFFLLSYTDQTTVGLFAIGSKIASFITLLGTAFVMAWDPYSYKIINNEEEYENLDFTLRILFLILLSFVIFLSLFSYEILKFIANEKYIEGGSIVGILSFGIVMSFLSARVGFGIIIKKKTIFLSFSLVIGAIISIILYILLIKNFGMLGAALGSLAGYSTAAICAYFFGEKLVKLPFYIKGFIIPFFYVLVVVSLLGLNYKTFNENITISLIIIKILGWIFSILLILFLGLRKKERLKTYKLFKTLSL